VTLWSARNTAGCAALWLSALVDFACSSGELIRDLVVDLAVQAKREIGRLWIGADSDSGTQYHKLFNPRLTGDRLWKSVQVLREIEAALGAERAKRSGREKQIGVHGNRLIAHLVFRALPPGALSDSAGGDDHREGRRPGRRSDW
jgi:hypothetical protein